MTERRMTNKSDRIELERAAARRVDDELRTVLDGGGKVAGITTVRVIGGDWTTVEGLLERAYQAGRADVTDEVVEGLERRARWSMAASERLWAGSGYQDEKGMSWYAIAAGVMERMAARLRPVEPPIAPPAPGPTKAERFIEQYPGMTDLVEADRTEVVYPRGVPTRVPRGKCRCPILQVGDFCPVHGG